MGGGEGEQAGDVEPGEIGAARAEGGWTDCGETDRGETDRGEFGDDATHRNSDNIKRYGLAGCFVVMCLKLWPALVYGTHDPAHHVWKV